MPSVDKTPHGLWGCDDIHVAVVNQLYALVWPTLWGILFLKLEEGARGMVGMYPAGSRREDPIHTDATQGFARCMCGMQTLVETFLMMGRT